MSKTHFDLIVIGAGPGGYVAAIRASQLGLKTACIDKRETWGGTCLNIGCIPSKALLHSSEKFEEARDQLANHGVKVGRVELDLKTLMARKDKVVDDLTKGIGFLFKKNKVTGITGAAKIVKPGEVRVTTKDGADTYTADNILIATGSEIAPLSSVEIDEDKIVSSTGALSLSKVPKHLVVVGGGYIGLEMGSVWRRLGSKVTVVEFLDTIVPNMDKEIGAAMHKSLHKQGIEFMLGTKVTGAKTTKTHVTLAIEPSAGGKSEDIKCDVVLVSIGRIAYTDGLGLEDVGIEMDNRGVIQVDDYFKTSVNGIYAIGDVTPGAMLAHKAEEEGIACVEHLAGHATHINYDAIPSVVYTWPEAASVGKTEEQLKEADVNYKKGTFPFMANSRARANGNTDGFVKILANKETDEVLGVHIIGPDAGTMIAELALAIEFGASSEDIARTCHAHPTLNEAVKEAALGVEGSSIHI
ncbi:MAG: Dihydrolipoyl dehydrogenase 3 [Alphaproteobacteria bacterium MarineAlpha11_Bin1]|nr:MAG: Dihydrolipoyl dehydrogenase 3 [Alphaproteobacteria bacterium MarineAlpha11_Bin1]|tara:strand:+ start:19203 stop:20609 length:1407 start_codon:yes stop_codon:yes gene_type:complete